MKTPGAMGFGCQISRAPSLADEATNMKLMQSVPLSRQSGKEAFHTLGSRSGGSTDREGGSRHCSVL